MPRTVEQIPGVFPFINIERDEDGWAKKVTITGISDTLVIEAKADAPLSAAWVDVRLNGEDYSVR